MNLKTRLDYILGKYNIIPDSKLDQNFLIDEKIIQKLVDYGNISRTDRVLEIGAGTGFITEELSRRSKEVLSIEKDQRFRPILNKLAKNVKVIFADANEFLDKHRKTKIGIIQKVITNMPFSLVEPILSNFIDWGPKKMIWIAPLSFINKLNNHPILGIHFEAILLEKIPKSAFFPTPNTILGIVKITRKI